MQTQKIRELKYNMDTDTYKSYYSKAIVLVQYFKKKHKELPFLGFEEDYKWAILDQCKGKSNLDIARILSQSPCNFLYRGCMMTMTDLLKSKKHELSKAIDIIKEEQTPFAERLTAFKAQIDSICEEGKSRPNDERTAAAILTCIDPQKYTFYMHDKVFVPYRDYLNAPKVKGSNYTYFLEIIQPLVDVIKKDQELQDIFHILSKDYEPSNLLSAQTLLWCIQDEWNKINQTNMFTWIPFYEELAGKLLQYKNNRKALLDWAYSDLQGYANALHDCNKNFTDIDPFTIIGLFNRQSSNKTRIVIAQKFKEHFGIQANLPEDFRGIPILNAQNSSFVANTSDPKYVHGCEDMIWNLLDAIVNDASKVEDYFNHVRTLPYVKNKMTMAMFWIRPNNYLALDKNNRAHLARLGFTLEDGVPEYKNYIALLDKLRPMLGTKKVPEKSFPEFSDSAWGAGANNANEENDPYQDIVHLWRSKKNLILQGAPGTGKTYSIPECVYRLCYNDFGNFTHESIMECYKELVQDGRVVFTTFHQSMDYENFIEGIKANITDEDVSGISYSIEPGIFKTLCDDARNATIVNANKLGLNDSPSIWKVSLQSTGKNPTRTECLENGHIRIGWDDYGENINEEITKGKSVLEAFYSKMQIGDIVLSCYSSKTIDAIGIVTSDAYFNDKYKQYKRVRDVKWLVTFNDSNRINIQKMNGGKVMTLGTIYRLNAISIEDVLSLLKDNHIKISSKKEQQEIPYILVIDEINRGNVSKILGELITLLEPDKRAGETNEISVKLPYSKTPFSVPSNVYIIGTMNTADRSVGYIDYAIRRRFAFYTIQANANNEIETYYEDKDEDVFTEAQSLFDCVQQFIEQHISPDFDSEDLMIGHSYFMAKDIDELEMKKLYEIRPLLNEYLRDGILTNTSKREIDDCLNIE